MSSIGSAVGKQPALNSIRDQQRVQDLLNQVPESEGGPAAPITAPIVANNVSPALQKAIIDFQNKNVEPRFRDGRIDHVGATITALEAKSRGGSSPPVQSKHRTHFTPVLPQGKNVENLPGELHPMRVENHVSKGNPLVDWRNMRQRIKEQLSGNPNAAAVEVFLDKIEAESLSSRSDPHLNTSVVFGNVEVGRPGSDKRQHNATPLARGDRVSTDESDTRPVILFGDTGGIAILPPRTLLIVGSTHPEVRNPPPVETTLVTGRLKEFMGHKAGAKRLP